MKDNGHISAPRWVQNLSIWHAKPFYLKVWLYLLFNAEYQDHGNLRKGQLFTNNKRIIDNCYHLEGYIIVYPTKDQVRAALDYLRKDREWPVVDSTGAPLVGPMITTRKATHGMIVTVCNYERLAAAYHLARPAENPNADHARPLSDTYGERTEDPNIIKENEYIKEELNMPAESAKLSTFDVIANTFNELSGSTYSSEDVEQYVKALLSAGKTIDDILLVINRKWSEWRDSDSMRPNFRPSVILRKEKFREYLNAPLSITQNNAADLKSKIENLKDKRQAKMSSLQSIKESLSSLDKKTHFDEYNNLKAQEAELEDSILRITKMISDNIGEHEN